jgi:hypothetical protein
LNEYNFSNGLLDVSFFLFLSLPSWQQTNYDSPRGGISVCMNTAARGSLFNSHLN